MVLRQNSAVVAVSEKRRFADRLMDEERNRHNGSTDTIKYS